MDEKFGSDSFFAQIKGAWEDNDLDQVAELLEKHVKCIGKFFLQKSCFSHYTFHDKEDAIQDAMLYVLQHIGSFLSDPRNDPKAPEGASFHEQEKNAWLRKTVFNGIRHSSRTILKHDHVSLDETIDSSPKSIALLNVIPLHTAQVDESLLAKEQVEEALRSLFSLPNEPATIIAVGYMILLSELEKKRFSVETYVEHFRKTSMAVIIGQMETLLTRHQLSTDVLRPLIARIGKNSSRPLSPDITAKKLTNRKSSMLNELKKKAQTKKTDCS